MYIEKEKREKLKESFQKIYSGYDNFSDSTKDLIDDTDICIEDIDKTKSNKVYVITNNAIVDDEIDYQIRGVAFTLDDANKIFEEAIRDAKIDADFENIDAIDVSNGTEYPDQKWHYSKSDDNFELYLEGEYNSNNFSIQIKEYDISKSINKDMEVDL